MTKSMALIAAAVVATGGSASDAAADRCTANVYAEVATVVWRYQNSVAQADRSSLNDVMSPIWNGKRISAADGRLIVETKEAALARMAARGPLPGADTGEALTSVQVFFGDFAVVRTDDQRRAATTIYTLFKLDGVWRVAGEASSNADVGVRQAHYNPVTAEADVLAVLGGYYKAVVNGDAAALDRIFHPDWHMKNHEGGAVVSEGNAAFEARVRNTPLESYGNDRQIADVQIAWDRLAYVRVDKPSSLGVTVFVFFRVDKRWLIVDKAWSVAKEK